MSEMGSIVLSVELLGYFGLPRGFLDSGDFAFVGELAETNAAEVKIAKISPFSSASETPINSPGTEFGLLF